MRLELNLVSIDMLLSIIDLGCVYTIFMVKCVLALDLDDVVTMTLQKQLW